MSRWKTLKLSEVFDLQMGKTPSRSNVEYWNDGSNKWISIADIGLADKFIYKTKETITDLAVIESGIRIVPKNTVIMSFKLSIGKTCIVLEDMYTNEAIMAFVDKGKYEIDNNFLYHMFRGKDWSIGINKAVMGSTLNKATLCNVEICIPPLETQKQIAKTLDTAVELLTMRKQQLAELDNLIKSVFYDMFGDPIINEKGWDLSTVDKVCSKIMGGGTPSKSNNEYYIGNIPWVTPKDMKTIWINDSIDHINEDAIKNSSAKLVPLNSVLMVIRSGILKRSLPVAINTVNIAINQDMKAFITNEKVLKEYLLYFFMIIQNNILKNVRAVTADNIEFSLIRNMAIPCPPISIQNQFATIVTEIEEQKVLVKKAIGETQYLFDSLMSEYFK